MSKTIIIGNGVAGITAAVNIRKLDDQEQILVISGETKYFYSRTALMYLFMGQMAKKDLMPYEDWFWDNNKIELKQNWVKSVDFNNKLINYKDQTSESYDKLIIATGSKPNRLSGISDYIAGVQGLYSMQDLELLELNVKRAKHAVVIGGGLIGVELCEMLLSRGIKVTMMVRDRHYWGNVLPLPESKMVSNHMMQHHVDFKFESSINSISADESKRIISIKTAQGETLPCDFLGITIGVSPNIDFLKPTELNINRGICVDNTLKTNIEDVYSIGDCAEIDNPLKNRKSVEAVWYAGRMMGETVAHTICGNKTEYKPGVWFNSAKFFDIEYQTYGTMEAELDANTSSFYWEESKADTCIRFNFNEATKALVGIHALNIRLRHVICNDWIKNNTPIHKVVSELNQAIFDAEFSKSWVKSITTSYNAEYSEQAVEQKFSWKKLLNLTK